MPFIGLTASVRIRDVRLLTGRRPDTKTSLTLQTVWGQISRPTPTPTPKGHWRTRLYRMQWSWGLWPQFTTATPAFPMAGV